jgi:DNA-binding MarR family transcriptional regulator
VTDATIRVPRGFRAEFPGAVPSAAEAAANLVRLAQEFLDEVNRRRRVVAPLSASAFEALAVLEGAGEPLPSTVIAERLLVTTASMTSLLDTLERRGLVIRRPHPTDRRMVLVELAGDAQRIVDQMLPIVHATATEAFSVLTEAERRTLVEVLGQVRARLATVGGEQPQAPKPRRKPRRR